MSLHFVSEVNQIRVHSTLLCTCLNGLNRTHRTHTQRDAEPQGLFANATHFCDCCVFVWPAGRRTAKAQTKRSAIKYAYCLCAHSSHIHHIYTQIHTHTESVVAYIQRLTVFAVKRSSNAIALHDPCRAQYISTSWR